MCTRWLHLLASSAILALSLSLVACGGGGGGSPAKPQDATVSLLITDAPVGRWDEAIATITSVKLIGDDAQVDLFEGSRTLDLLKLSDFSELFTASDHVPPGRYSKIRLQLSDLVLRDLDDQGDLVEEQHPQIVGNGKIDLNPRGSFDLDAGDVVFVELDFDMQKSLKITETGNGKLILRPVIFVNIRTEPRPDSRLTRIHGRIAGIDASGGTLRLCQTHLASTSGNDEDIDDEDDDGGSRCITVGIDDKTGIFSPDGEPEDLDGLAVGDEATAIGTLRPRAGHDEADGDDDYRVLLNAFVVEEGPLHTFRRLRGEVSSPVNPVSDRFDLALAAGQGISADGPLPVQLYAKSRIFSRDGQELLPGDIAVGRDAVVDGVLAVGTEDVIRAPLVMVTMENPPAESSFDGTIQTTNPLIVTVAGGDRCLDASRADVFLVSDVDGFSSHRGEVGDLAPGQSVSIFGRDGTGGCIAADTIIVEEN